MSFVRERDFGGEDPVLPGHFVENIVYLFIMIAFMCADGYLVLIMTRTCSIVYERAAKTSKVHPELTQEGRCGECSTKWTCYTNIRNASSNKKKRFHMKSKNEYCTPLHRSGVEYEVQQDNIPRVRSTKYYITGSKPFSHSTCPDK